MSDRNEALRLADSIDFGTEDFDCLRQKTVTALRRLTAEQAVMLQWISEAVRELKIMNPAGDLADISALCESGRRLVDGGPDDLLAGVE